MIKKMVIVGNMPFFSLDIFQITTNQQGSISSGGLLRAVGMIVLFPKRCFGQAYYGRDENENATLVNIFVGGTFSFIQAILMHF